LEYFAEDKKTKEHRVTAFLSNVGIERLREAYFKRNLCHADLPVVMMRLRLGPVFLSFEIAHNDKT